MDQQRPQGFWTNRMRQRPANETNSARNPTPVLSGAPDDPTQMMTPPYSHQSDSLLDGEKTRAMLLISGVVLAVVGATFTFMGWRYYQDNPRFEWLQLLGPILISFGGTFVLTSVYKFSTNFSWSCRQGDEDVLAMSVTEQTSRGHCCTISGRNQPIMIHDVTTILCTPPEYNFITQEVQQPRSSVSGIHAAPPPPHDAVYCVENAALTSQEASSDNRGNR